MTKPRPFLLRFIRELANATSEEDSQDPRGERRDPGPGGWLRRSTRITFIERETTDDE